tara:strand:- start:27403 stop:28434 length:1032 start_codon:yes stop_codon:yes gene_type:complete
VSLSIIGFALFSYAIKGNYDKLYSQTGPKWTHPIIGSLCGAIPGCGATIVISSLYKNKKISFGGLFAAFISTLGEGSFVLLGSSSESEVIGNLKAYLIITFFGFFSGIIFGYLLDYFGFRSNYEDIQETNFRDRKDHYEERSVSDFRNIITNTGYYAILVMAIFLAPSSIMALWGGEISSISELTYIVSVFLTVICAIFYFLSSHLESCNSQDIKSTTLHAIIDVSMVVTYVFIGLFVANYIIDAIVGPETFHVWMTSSVYIVIFLSALIGVIPGCGGMIVVAAAFIIIPNFPLSALIAASIATSGDGIFPLLAENQKDGVLVSLLGLLLALFMGYVSFILGF